MDNNEIWQAMLAGEIYDATHPELIRRLEITRDKLWEFNNTLFMPFSIIRLRCFRYWASCTSESAPSGEYPYTANSDFKYYWSKRFCWSPESSIKLNIMK